MLIFHAFYNHNSPEIEKTDPLVLSKSSSFSRIVTKDKNILYKGTKKRFVKDYFDSKNNYSEDDISNMLKFLVDNIFVAFAGKVFKQTVCISIDTNCAPLLADIFLFSYEVEFIQYLLSTGKKQLASFG